MEADRMNDLYLPPHPGVALHTGAMAGQMAPDGPSCFKTLDKAGRSVSSQSTQLFGGRGEVSFIIPFLQKKKLRFGSHVTCLRSHICPRMSPSL